MSLERLRLLIPLRPRRSRSKRSARPIVAVLIAWVAACLVAMPSIAQDVTTATSDQSADEVQQQPNGGRTDRVQQVGPDTYILLDAEGRPRAMPGMTYEDFLTAWKHLQQVDRSDRNPRFAIERVEMVGHAHDRYAELQCEITVRLFDDETVDVPLGLTEAILQGDARFSTPSASTETGDEAGTSPERSVEEYLFYEPQRGGFVARLAAGAGQRRTVSVSLLVPLVRDAAGSTISLTCPRSASSRLALDVNAAVAEVDVSSGVLTSQKSIAGGTRLSVAGAIGPFRMSWQTPDVAAGSLATVLNAQGAIRVAIDGRSVRTSAQLTVQSYGSSFDRLRVQLPRGAQLIQDRQASDAAANSGYRLSLEPMPPEGDGRRQIVLVEFSEKQRGPITIELTTEQPIGMAADSTVELGGMEVLGAVRQFGDLVLQVAPDWQARWEIGAHVRQVDPAEVDAVLQQPEVSAAFQYDRVPWSLAMRIEARKFRVLVTPEYRLDLARDEARLTVRLAYQVLGARTFNFRVDLRGWELTTDSVESGGLVDPERITISPDGVLEMPLSQALSRRAEVMFNLRRDLAPDDQFVRMPLPMPIADSVSPGELVVYTDDQFDLAPDLARSIGMLPRSNSDSIVVVAADEPNGHHFRTASTEAVFAADRILRSREISHEVHTSVDFEEADIQVEQRVDYDVRYQPVDELSFELPAEISSDAAAPQIALLTGGDTGDMEPTLREIPLGLSLRRSENRKSATEVADKFQVRLPQARLGEFSLVIRYGLDRPNRTNAAKAWQLPLVKPLDGKLLSHRVACRTSRPVTIALDAAAGTESWKQTTPSEGAGSDSYTEFWTATPEAYLPLFVRTAAADAPAETFVDRIWLQTWVSGNSRQDRTAFRFRTAGSQVAVELAPQTPDVIEVLLNGERAHVLSREAGRIVVAVPQGLANGSITPGDGPATPHTLELFYRIPISAGLLTRHVMTPHQMVGSAALAESYWQVMLPADTHMVRSPSQMTAAGAWQWLGTFWGRRPTRSQSELEKWSGASPQIASAPSQNEYLFAGLAPVSTMEFVTAPRWLIVLIASASVLGLVLASIYVPSLRQRWSLAALACILAGMALAFPTAAILLAQASVLGLVAAVLAILIARLVARPAPWSIVVPASGAYRDVATPRPESIVVPSLAATASTSPTVPLRAPESE